MNPLLHHQRAMDAYGSATETVPAARQIVMLYDGMIRRIEEARQACLEGRVEERWRATQKAVRICDALQACLDHEQGGSMAATLGRWYAMVAMKMQQINVGNEADRCSEIIGLLRDVRASWDGIAREQPQAPSAFVRPAAIAASNVRA